MADFTITGTPAAVTTNLSLEYGDFRRAMAEQVGWGRGVTPAWTTDQSDQLDEMLASALRKVYYPVDRNGRAYQWKFLEKGVTITTADGTASYALSSDFGGVFQGDLTYPAGDTLMWPPVKFTKESQIRRKRQEDDTEGRPQLFAINSSGVPTTAAQAWSIIFWPTPDAVYSLSGRYRSVPTMLDTTNTYPAGGAQMAEVVLQACLAVAEQRMDNAPGAQTQLFEKMLADAIEQDKLAYSPDTLGYNSDTSDRPDYASLRYRNGDVIHTFNGTAYY